MCLEIFPTPANVPILHSCPPVGGVEKGPCADWVPRNLCLSSATNTH